MDEYNPDYVFNKVDDENLDEYVSKSSINFLKQLNYTNDSVSRLVFFLILASRPTAKCMMISAEQRLVSKRNLLLVNKSTLGISNRVTLVSILKFRFSTDIILMNVSCYVCVNVKKFPRVVSVYFQMYNEV